MHVNELLQLADDLRLTFPSSSTRRDARLARGFIELWEMLQKERDERTAFVVQALKNIGADIECGACMEIAFTGMTMSGHSCDQKA